MVSKDGYLSGAGEIEGLIRSKEWSETSVGPPHGWPTSMQTVVRLMLASRYSMWMGWGPDLAFFYNDAYRPTLGLKHPWALGMPAQQVWSEIWPDIGPRIRQVFETGRATYDEALLLLLKRSGFPEETYHTFSYSPIADDDGRIAGMLCVVTEDTERIISERRMALLRDLGSKLAATNTQPEVVAVFERCVSDYEKDLPFTLTYLLDPDHPGRFRLLSAVGIAEGHPAAPSTIETQSPTAVWPAAGIFAQSGPVIVSELRRTFDTTALPTGAWNVPPQEAVIMPVKFQGQEQPVGFIVAAVNPYRRFDKSYSGFVELLAGQLAAALSNAQAYQAERERAEALAELDRAKTAFFSNVSHEFRTPLTLLLGPLEEALANSSAGAQQEQLTVAHRNALRLLRLVNSLLDFSRIEAGRTQAAYQPIDLASLTAELAGVFRSAIEKAGLRLIVDCVPLPEPVYVDPEMWEKIVLNLLSNAFKFTFEGEIAVVLRASANGAELKIKDTGIGISAEQIPHIFERFHRVEGARGRSHEGTGIGLALVQELVKLHSASISVESASDAGTTFIISLPFGSAHLPQARIRPAPQHVLNASRREAFLEEAIHWLAAAADGSVPDQAAQAVASPAATLLVADDNADMREYVRRLLSDQYEVMTVANGLEALEAAVASPPDLVLSDVMMPLLDGFGLLKELRANPATVGIPVILLSARAGEEARTEGMDSGADDYLVKPFSARELSARVAAHLKLARIRKEAEGRASLILESIKDGFVALDAEWRYTYVNGEAERLNGLSRQEHLGRTIWEIFPAVLGTILEEKLRYAATQRVQVDYEYRHSPTDHWFVGTVYPTRDGGLSIFFRDITEQKRAAEALHESETRFRRMAEALPQLVWTCRPNGDCDYLSAQWVAYTGIPEEEQLGLKWLDLVMHPDDRARTYEAWMKAIQSVAPYDLDYRLRRYDGTYRWFKTRGTPLRDPRGGILRWFGTCTDIDDQIRIESELRRANQDLEQFAFSASHDLQEPLRMVTIYTQLLQRRYSHHLDQQADEFIGFVTRGAKQMEVLLKDLLAYTRAATVDDSTPVELTSTASVLRDVEESLSAAIEQSGAVILTGNLPGVRVKRVHLMQLFQNLVGNAIKYRSEQPPEIHITAERKGVEWLFSVRDNGIGINPKYKELVFGIFKRLHGQKYEGSGIGLAICQRIVERYGGHIWIDSQLAIGSTFFFTLPA